MARGKSVKIVGLPKQVRNKLCRAISLGGFKSQAAWIGVMARRTIREEELKHGDLMRALTPDESDIVEVVRDGANDPEDIADETRISLKKLDLILSDLVDRGILELKRQGGKTESARGARRRLYFLIENHSP